MGGLIFIEKCISNDIFVIRYSPLLAYMMIPNMWSPSIGKLVFVMFDILAGHLIYCILRCTKIDNLF